MVATVESFCPQDKESCGNFSLIVKVVAMSHPATAQMFSRLLYPWMVLSHSSPRFPLCQEGSLEWASNICDAKCSVLHTVFFLLVWITCLLAVLGASRWLIPLSSSVIQPGSSCTSQVKGWPLLLNRWPKVWKNHRVGETSESAFN